MNNRRILVYVICFLIGIVLFVLGCAELVDSFWCGMGSGLMAVGILRFVQFLRLQRDENYREKAAIDHTDERNRFIRSKAWAWAGYLFVLIVSVLSIVLRVAGQELLAGAAAYAVCLLLLLFWGCYFVLRRKY